MARPLTTSHARPWRPGDPLYPKSLDAPRPRKSGAGLPSHGIQFVTGQEGTAKGRYGEGKVRSPFADLMNEGIPTHFRSGVRLDTSQVSDRRNGKTPSPREIAYLARLRVLNDKARGRARLKGK